MATAGEISDLRAGGRGAFGEELMHYRAAWNFYVLRRDAIDRDLAPEVSGGVIRLTFAINHRGNGAHAFANAVHCLPHSGRRRSGRATVAGRTGSMAEGRARWRGRRADRRMWHPLCGSAGLHVSWPVRLCGWSGLLRCGGRLGRRRGLLRPLRAPPGGGRRLLRRAARLGSWGGSAEAPPPRALRLFWSPSWSPCVIARAVLT